MFIYTFIHNMDYLLTMLIYIFNHCYDFKIYSSIYVCNNCFIYLFIITIIQLYMFICTYWADNSQMHIKAQLDPCLASECSVYLNHPQLDYVFLTHFSPQFFSPISLSSLQLLLPRITSPINFPVCSPLTELCCKVQTQIIIFGCN